MSWRSWLSLLVSVGCLGLALHKLEPARLAAPEPVWFLLGLGCALVSLAAAALRWYWVASRLGLGVSLRAASGEVLAASLLNQLLPTGVAGELLRVAHHARRTTSESAAAGSDAALGMPRALRAVVLDRLSGQVSLWVCALPTAALWLEDARREALVAVALGLLGCVLAGWRGAASSARWLGALRADAAQVTRAGGAAVVFGTSLLLVLGCIAQFACCSRALGVTLGPSALWRVAPPVLLAMALPLSLGGLGVRESTTAALYAALGLTASSGSAVGVLYGLLSLLGSLPGVWPLVRARWAAEAPVEVAAMPPARGGG
jgi:uncharacterized membrane protein YbhN (UPF0104 family)